MEINHIEKQLENARNQLLDLTMRNRLLNYRPRKAGSIKIIDEIIAEVFNILVIKENIMQFLPKVDAKSESKANDKEAPGGDRIIELSDGDHLEIWEMPDYENGLANRHTDRYLQTSLDRNALQKRLFYIQKQANSIMKEQGYNIHYLALGFLLESTEFPRYFRSMQTVERPQF